MALAGGAVTDPILLEAFDMETLGITDYAVYERQPQDILDRRRAILVERARLQKIAVAQAKAEADAMRGRR